MGLDKLKWVMRAIIYTPILGTIVAFILLFAIDGQSSFDEIYGAGKAAEVMAAADDAGVEDAVMSAWDAMTGVLLSVLWAYSALEVTSFVGSEVKTPRTSFLRGLIGGAVAVGIIYTINAWSSGFSFGSEFIRDYAYLFYTDDTTFAALETAMGQTPPQPTMPFYAGINGGNATLAILHGLLLLLLVRQHEHPDLARRRARHLLDGVRPSAAAQARLGGRLGQPDVGQPLPRHLRLPRRGHGVRRLDRRGVGGPDARPARLRRPVLHLADGPGGDLPAVPAPRPVREVDLPVHARAACR